ADSYIWSALSGPAPKILDPQAFSLAVTAPRVKSDTQIVYRFSAEYEDHTENRNVVIMIRNSIPDPSIALPAKASWNGAAPLVLRPTVSNAAALKDVPNAPPLRYLWSLSAQLADTSQAGDSLKLSNPSGDGVMNVTLCMDNGGEANCAVTPVTVSRTSSGLAGFRTRGSDPVSVSGRSLFWRVPGRVRMWNWQGILLWEGRGRAGEITHMNAAAAGALARRRARLELLP
ncbi:MAG: hypothetical protein ABI036_09290, partial [Fibrobacteria bacterium]